MKKKIHKYDFLIIGAGLIGSLAALALHKKKFKVLAIDKQSKNQQDKSTKQKQITKTKYNLQLPRMGESVDEATEEQYMNYQQELEDESPLVQ